MTDETKNTFFGILREYGFATVLSCALLYVGRQDLILPLVRAHEKFLADIAATQHEISQAIGEQTRLLYAMQSHVQQHNGTKAQEPPK